MSWVQIIVNQDYNAMKSLLQEQTEDDSDNELNITGFSKDQFD